MSFAPVESDHAEPPAPGTDWEATMYEAAIQLRVGPSTIQMPRIQALRLAHAIFAAYGVSGTQQ